MEVYTITLQFRVEAESKYAAKSKGVTLLYNLTNSVIPPVQGVLEVLSCDVDYYSSLADAGYRDDS